MKLVTAIVRTSSVERVVHALERKGVRGMTISEIKGLGEEGDLTSAYKIHDKIEVIVPDDVAEQVVELILESSRTGLAGDGVITVADLEKAVKVRTKELMT